MITLRHELSPGDLARHLYRTLCAREYGFDSTFEAYVARPLAEFSARIATHAIACGCGDEQATCWLLESSAFDKVRSTLVSGRSVARPGLGKQLLDEAIALPAEQPESIFLWTVSALIGGIFDAQVHQ